MSDDLVPVTAEDLEATSEAQRLSVMVDGARAEMFVAESGFSYKVVLQFAEPHNEFGDVFATKYYEVPEPGVLAWGHEGRRFSVNIAP